MEGDVPAGVALDPSTAPSTTTESVPSMDESMDVEQEQPEPTTDDNRPHPRPFESLREFFTRTSNAWQELVLENVQSIDGASNQSVKGLRKVAFDLAETKWWDCREEIMAEEESQEQAGIGEVVNIADRTNEAGAVGRRR